jgi:hypothetical protein
MESADEANSRVAERGIEGDLGSAARLAIKEIAHRDGGTEHFFEAQGLRAELDFIGLMRFGLAAFIFDGPRAVATEFDDIRAAGNAITERAEAEAAADADAVAQFDRIGIGVIVQYTPFGGEPVLLPLLFEMDESPLALAEDEMLERGEREEIGFGKHGSDARLHLETVDHLWIETIQLGEVNAPVGIHRKRPMHLSRRVLARLAIVFPPDHLHYFHAPFGTGRRGIVFK